MKLHLRNYFLKKRSKLSVKFKKNILKKDVFQNNKHTSMYTRRSITKTKISICSDFLFIYFILENYFFYLDGNNGIAHDGIVDCFDGRKSKAKLIAK